MTVRVVVADSVTALGPEARGAVLVTGSHGGMIAAHYALEAGVRAAVFNDAGRGLDDAGIAGVMALAGAGMAAAAVSHASARIAQAADTLARGEIAHANATAASLGVIAGMACREAVERLRLAPMPSGVAFPGSARRARCWSRETRRRRRSLRWTRSAACGRTTPARCS